MISDALEFLGVLCLAAFLYFIWPAAALIPIGIYLIIAGYALDHSDGADE